MSISREQRKREWSQIVECIFWWKSNHSNHNYDFFLCEANGVVELEDILTEMPHSTTDTFWSYFQKKRKKLQWQSYYIIGSGSLEYILIVHNGLSATLEIITWIHFSLLENGLLFIDRVFRFFALFYFSYHAIFVLINLSFFMLVVLCYFPFCLLYILHVLFYFPLYLQYFVF